MQKPRISHWGVPLAMGVLFSLTACSMGTHSGSDSSSQEPVADEGPDLGVGQGGAQDFGAFKEILENGQLPAPTTLDDVGFFNEHQISFGDADCGENVCIHGRLGMAGNMISGSPCTLLLIGMNTPLKADEIPRPPLNLGIAVDVSGSMGGSRIAYTIAGLQRMQEALYPQDRVHLIAFNQDASVLVEDSGGDSESLAEAIADLQAGGSTNLHAGLERAFQTVEAHADPERQNRVILLSDGEPTVGITDSEGILGMGALWNLQGYALTTIGVGDGFSAELLRELSEQGSGAFYFVQDPADIDEVFVEEVEAYMVPIASDVSIDVDVESSWALRQLYGTKLSLISGNSAAVKIPTLQIAHRTSDTDNTNGRRGGGGAIVAEVLPFDTASSGRIGSIDFEYEDPFTGEVIEQTVAIDSPVGPDETYFEDDGVDKAFAMLNLYVGFRMAADASVRGELAEALGILIALETNVEDWLSDHPDADIEDDLRYVQLFIQNVDAAAAAQIEPEQPDDPEWD